MLTSVALELAVPIKFQKTVDQYLDRGTVWFSALKTTITTVCRFGFSALVLVFSVGFSSFPGEGGVWFSLNGTTYQNNSCVPLEDIGEGGGALFCVTNFTACCRPLDTIKNMSAGNWFFPNGSKVPGSRHSQQDIYRDRGKMVVRLNRRRGGEEGIYCCEIPNSMNVTQTIYIGMYTTSSGE